MIRLSSDQIDFLLRTLQLTPALREGLEKARAAGGLVGDEEADALRDLCGERLQTHGFGPHYELTEEGMHLEKMIDRLFIG